MANQKTTIYVLFYSKPLSFPNLIKSITPPPSWICVVYIYQHNMIQQIHRKVKDPRL